MSNYTKTTNFTAKDSLLVGDPNKIIKGAEHDVEYDAIETAVNSKANTSSPTFTGTANFSAIASGALTGTTINNSVIGGSTPAAGTFSTFTLASGATVTAILDEDALTTDSATALATQQSIKAYADTKIATSSLLDEDDMASNSAVAVPSQQSTKAYVDAQVIAANSLSGALVEGNTTGANDIVVTAGQAVTTDTINETTAAAGVTIDGVLIKDGLVDGVDVTALGTTANPLSQFASTTSSQLAGVISDETGSGALVFGTSPTLITPVLGTPTSGTLTNCTGLPAAGVTGTAATLGANTFTAAQNFADNTLQRANLLDYGEVTNAIGSTGGGTQDIDLTLGNVVSATVDTSANTFTFSNFTASDECSGFVLILTNGGSQTVNWPASVDWPGATAPTLTASGVDVLVFFSIDGGTTVIGNLVGAAYA